MPNPSDNFYDARIHDVIMRLEREAELERRANKSRLRVVATMSVIIVTVGAIVEVGALYFNFTYRELLQSFIAPMLAIVGTVFGYFFGRNTSEKTELDAAKNIVYNTLKEAISLREDAIEINRSSKRSNN